jgi:hypothetical protein
MNGKNTLKTFKEKTGVKPLEALTKQVRKQAEIKSKILKALKEPKTIPEISKETGLDLKLTTWYVLTFTRYKVLEATEKTDEGFWKYQVAEESKVK